MSDPSIDIPVEKDPPPGDDLPFPIAGLIIIVICLYLLAVLIFLLVRKLILSKGFCQDFHICGNAKGEAGCCECLIPCVEALNCKVTLLTNLLPNFQN